VIVRWGIEEVAPLLARLGMERPLLVTSSRFADIDLPVAERFAAVRRHAPVEVVAAATDAAAGADGLVTVGGGSAIDTSKAVSAATGLELVAVPTTYSGSEWTPGYGMRDEVRGIKTGGSGSNTVAIVYEPELTLELSRGESVGTAMNALAHCAEALYKGPSDDASTGAALIASALPRVVRDGRQRSARTELLHGAEHAGRALADRGMGLAHAMAQALGGRYGISHGAANALCLAPALRFNEAVVPEAVWALAAAIGADDAVEGVVRLAALGEFGRLRDLGIPADELSDVAVLATERPAARANPRPTTSTDVEALYRSIW
jgi:alcohol dehydrogenase class IV